MSTISFSIRQDGRLINLQTNLRRPVEQKVETMEALISEAGRELPGTLHGPSANHCCPDNHIAYSPPPLPHHLQHPPIAALPVPGGEEGGQN